MDRKVISKVTVGISARHVHLSREDMDKLFGPGSELTFVKALTQPGQFSAEEKVTLVGPKREIKNVRVLGPLRSQTQVEISRTDAFTLGIEPPVRDSGDLANSAPLKIVGPKGEVELKEGAIIAKRHIHMTPADAERLGLKDKQLVSVRVKEGERALTFDEVLVRVSEKFALDFHVDTDEANAAGLKNGQLVEIIL
ncbi:MAG: phosphate propanoyltransferase [Firmicutes bacterium]|nr:phosphate propanoyltransferase [Bacillota bacterium]HOB22850.1 phosphate propanoyltransferase [Bacillota bacterium]